MVGIYKITNKLNGHSYIGQSTNIEHRWKAHKNTYNWEREIRKPLYLAFKKYGIEHFYIEEIEEVENDLLDEREKFSIWSYWAVWLQYA